MEKTPFPFSDPAFFWGALNLPNMNANPEGLLLGGCLLGDPGQFRAQQDPFRDFQEQLL